MTSHTQKARRWALSASIILALLLCMIAIVVWQDTQLARQSGITAGTARGDIDTVRITRPGHVDIVLTRKHDSWQMSAPCSLAVNRPRLDPLLMLVNPSVHSYATSEVDLDAAGLITPLASLFFNGSQVDIGLTDLGGERRYIKRQDRVEFAPEWVYSLVSGGLSAFAQLAVFPAALESISITREGDQALQIEGLVQHWQKLEAQQIIALPLPDAASALDSWKLDARTTDNTPLHMMLYRFASYAAFVPENSQCAFLLPTDTLPEAVRSL